MVADGVIGRYQLVNRVGTGSFATVWHGYDPDLDVPVAIKVLAENWAHDLDVRHRFLDEARLLRRVRDQHVVRVHDIGTLPDDRPYFVMDFADHGTIADLIATASLDVAEALRLGAEVARAVQVLHDHGVAHRDIKPGNLLLTSQVASTQRSVVVADLGMAKSLSEASGFTVTAGTPAYMAPEQALGLGFDHRADVYAVGAVTYAMLSGRPPFSGGLTEIAERARAGPPEPLGLDQSGALDAELARALSADPDQRPASARELAERLDRWAQSWSGSTRPETPEPTVVISADRPDEATVSAAPPGPSALTMTLIALLVMVTVAMLTWLTLSALPIAS